MLRMLQEAGVFGWIVVLFGFLALGLSVAYAAILEPILRWIAVGALAATAVVAVLGVLHGREIVDAAVAGAEPSFADELRQRGYAEAARVWQLAAPFVVLGAAAFAVAELRRRKKT